MPLAHPLGEQPERVTAEPSVVLETFAGRVHVEWEPQAPVTALGQLPFFIEFLKQGGLFESWVADGPLSYSSPNAPQKRDVLGTVVLSILAGHWRYAHITAVRGDGVNPDLLGMTRVVSEDAVRRGLKKIPAADGRAWLQRHLDYTTLPLLGVPWVLDVDTTVKPLFGHKERWSATIHINPAGPCTRCILIWWLACAWCWMSRSRPAMNTPRRIRCRSCGRCWTGWGATAGLGCCAAMPILAPSGL